MPLKQGYSKRSIGSNIKTEMAHGKPYRVAKAIAMRVAAKAKTRRRRK